MIVETVLTMLIDVTFRWISLYIFAMKLFFIASSLYIIFLMRNRFRTSEVTKLDTFPIVYLLAGSGVLALIFTYDYSITEVLWAFSLFLESVAILPQLFMLQRTGQAKTLTTHYIFALGLYRALYIPNWFYRYFAEGRFDTLAVFTGIVQTLIYSDFFWVYYNRVMKGLNFELPV